jgi:hypothetical protein
MAMTAQLLVTFMVLSSVSGYAATAAYVRWARGRDAVRIARLVHAPPRSVHHAPVIDGDVADPRLTGYPSASGPYR